MEVDDDDAFFAELNRRISLIIMDDDEVPVATYPSVTLKSFSGAIYNPSVQSSYMYEQITCKREISKGTGVFIPQSPQLKRKNRRGRSNNSFTTKSHHNQSNGYTRGSVVDSHVPYSDIDTSNSPPYSFNKS